MTASKTVATATLALLGAAVVKELRVPARRRTWQGAVAGVPYDLRPPTVERFRRAWFNPDDRRILTPRDFGVGWAVNFAALGERLAGH